MVSPIFTIANILKPELKADPDGFQFDNPG